VVVCDRRSDIVWPDRRIVYRRHARGGSGSFFYPFIGQLWIILEACLGVWAHRSMVIFFVLASWGCASVHGRWIQARLCCPNATKLHCNRCMWLWRERERTVDEWENDYTGQTWEGDYTSMLGWTELNQGGVVCVWGHGGMHGEISHHVEMIQLAR
jgi:hypothetical protein